MMRNIFAYTETGYDYPAYVSVNRVDHETNVVSITVRSAGTPESSMIELPESEFDRLCFAVISNSHPIDMAKPFGDTALLSVLKIACLSVEQLPPSNHQSQLSLLLGTAAHGLQQLLATGDYQWPKPT